MFITWLVGRVGFKYQLASIFRPAPNSEDEQLVPCDRHTVLQLTSAGSPACEMGSLWSPGHRWWRCSPQTRSSPPRPPAPPGSPSPPTPGPRTMSSSSRTSSYCRHKGQETRSLRSHSGRPWTDDKMEKSTKICFFPFFSFLYWS